MDSRPLRLRFVTSATRAAQLPDVERRGRVRRAVQRRQVGAHQRPRQHQATGAGQQHAGAHAVDQHVRARRGRHARRPAGLRLCQGPRPDPQGLAGDDRGLPARTRAAGAGVRAGRRRDRSYAARRADARVAAGQRVPHTVVATKLDKVKSSKRPARRRDLAAGCRLDPDDIVWTSATKGENIDLLRDLVRSHLSNHPVLSASDCPWRSEADRFGRAAGNCLLQIARGAFEADSSGFG